MTRRVLHVFYSGLGGHGSVFFSLVAAGHLNTFDTHVLLYGIEQPRPDYVARLNNLGIEFSYVKKTKGMDLGFWPNIFSCIRRVGPDTVFLHGSYNVLPAWIYKIFVRRCRIVVRETQANHLKTRLDWFLLVLAFGMADAMVFLSVVYRDEVAAKLRGLFNTSKAQIIPNGIDLTVFSRLERPPGDPNGYRMGMVSRIVDIKDHATLIRAFERLKRDDVSLYIAGDGAALPSLRRLVADLNLDGRVIFTGVVDERDLPAFLASLDVYVHATLGETMSTAIMQAQSVGLPIIATDVPGVNNVLVDGENGLLVKPRDISSYEHAMRRLLVDPALRSRLADSSRAYAVAHLSMGDMFAKYAGIL